MQSPATDRTVQTTLGELIAAFYQEFLDVYGDEELASIATAAMINDLLAEAASADYAVDAA